MSADPAVAVKTCPRCRLTYPDTPWYAHVCTADAKTFYYFFRLRDDHLVHSLVLVGAIEEDPLLAVETLAPDGSTQRWARRRESGNLVFCPPDGYAGAQGLVLRYSKDIQRHEAAPRELMERWALGSRHSVDLGAR